MANNNLKAGNVLLRPRITEKAALGADKAGVYVFEVASRATKAQIAGSIKATYKVTPVKVRTVTMKPAAVFVRGKRGMQKGGKKAYVYLKKGDKIELL